MKKSILEQFAADAINAPVAITGGTGKCVKKTGSHRSAKSRGSKSGSGKTGSSRSSGSGSTGKGGGGSCAPKPKTPKTYN
jgi:hypothetical protein